MPSLILNHSDHSDQTDHSRPLPSFLLFLEPQLVSQMEGTQLCLCAQTPTPLMRPDRFQGDRQGHTVYADPNYSAPPIFLSRWHDMHTLLCLLAGKQQTDTFPSQAGHATSVPWRQLLGGQAYAK